MIHRLHKIAAVLLIGLPFALGWYLYQNREIFAPVNDFSDALQLWEGKFEKDRETVSGKIIDVGDNYTFGLKNDNGEIFRFRLTGIEAPSLQRLRMQNVSAILAKSREEMRELTLSNSVQVVLTYRDGNQTGLGVLYVGGTNVNALLVRRGLAQLKREFLRGLKLTELYALLRAERAAREIDPK
ncbi:MAG: thermonuclease family protein [Verrucomicrobia bacterium]|nr:thermonuclease family protein [Verrucomicrobiota bacterium]